MARRSEGAVWDRTAALLRDPYRFILRGCRRRGADAFATRLLLEPAVCVTGPHAAAVFQDHGRFTRHRAVPRRINRTLFGRGGVQGLDGAEHGHRKSVFLALMSPERVAELTALVEREFDCAAEGWRGRRKVVLYDEFRAVLTRAVCTWAGVPLVTADADRRTAQLTALYDYAARVGPRHWRSRLARRAAEDWAADVVGRIRAGRIEPPEDTAAHALAWHREPDGGLLDEHTAAVELLNVVRPVVAVSVYLAFAAHALHRHPRWRCELAAEAAAGGTDEAAADGAVPAAELFAQEVRRHYPFFPFVAARARHDMVLHGLRIARGRRVLLDLYGINHDPLLWEAPDDFRPERFRGWRWNLYDFVPQGAGDPATSHRCPGEPITVSLIKAVSRRLSRLDYEVPEQDFTVDMGRVPALPRSRCVIRVPEASTAA
ncbi:cytochrome P450 [Streptomonospora litoralis]|uniref:Fatty-acid peroxygenase n=1 Tax=Streptomonospora litoralis TaxID=2498135 RepID=A0A4V0ZJJ8_9ACTN|nr:cytochrome P450 [Streptomonospora litoralis]QBI53732.1 Fatty-acid peroxygenase [Streptomonospora litoralis]